ncbi:MAG TPA: type II toxin-antitoxin system HicB family antitoxin [Clostridia bacterium]|nr:type II toxin-antitoxin system HicB family antitoxin [Clostridia bacterium]
MEYKIEIEEEDDGRWIADLVDLPGVMAYGSTPEEALTKVQALAYRVLADRIEQEREPRKGVRFAIA